ncbi:MAG: hypothetical protein DYG83_07440 [Candidatus Brocadia sp. AMX2]|uniref:Lipoprotein n=1 Tax=Candidatus Brocadia sinica JPN1 TaxID=1197129 RepID=A0ABQ0JZS5_9BACT|nr:MULTISPECIES: hypothetical protein [Brocadia]KXK32132.1 MAG: hypothetical protein UZ01_00593 [Candidatus Brocadia sinica]MBC6931512.1 hypothetical protein [Candidatus Brocadia sp.]MBL1169101.1 hypothetical protein [Candidatus Brocadia sp. AMX1]NOG42048.1 hypothetical protein [Planctomycetota bacterium]KAA0244889.1 MAG: hypothetical protein EDM70_04590 [Candidatus Brocadia sp. AMX2]
MKRVFVVSCAVFFIFLQGCKTEHKVEVDVKPMQITIDVNIRIDRELENFFGNLDEAAQKVGGEKTEEVSEPAQ